MAAPINYRLSHHNPDDWPETVAVPEITVSRALERVHRGVPDDCWLYNGGFGGATVSYPTATFMFRGHKYRVRMSRLVLMLHLDRPIKPALLACHRCNVKFCCNPGHIYEGTDLDNWRDRAEYEAATRHLGRIVPWQPKQRQRPVPLSCDAADAA